MVRRSSSGLRCDLSIGFSPNSLVMQRTNLEEWIYGNVDMKEIMFVAIQHWFTSNVFVSGWTQWNKRTFSVCPARWNSTNSAIACPRWTSKSFEVNSQNSFLVDWLTVGFRWTVRPRTMNIPRQIAVLGIGRTLLHSDWAVNTKKNIAH